jgi:hypothetical protein
MQGGGFVPPSQPVPNYTAQTPYPQPPQVPQGYMPQQQPQQQGYTFGQQPPQGPQYPAPQQWQQPQFQQPYAQPQQLPLQYPAQPQYQPQPQMQPFTVGQPPAQYQQPQPQQQAQNAFMIPQGDPNQQALAQQTAPAPALPAAPFTFGIGVDPAVAQAQAAIIAEQQFQQHLIAVAKKDGPEAAFRAQANRYETQISAYQKAVTTHTRDADVSGALFGMRFVSESAAKQTLASLSERFESVLGPNGQFTTVDKATKQPAAQVIKQILAGPEFAHCLLPTTQGGGPPSQGNFTTPSQQFGGQQQPISEGEQNWLAWRQKVEAQEAQYGSRYQQSANLMSAGGPLGLPNNQGFQLNGYRSQ